MPPAAEIRVRLVPRASREEIVGEQGGAIVLRVSAPPHGGQANEAMRRLLAKRAGVARGRVTIVTGAKARDKRIRVEGISDAELRRRLLG